MGNIDMVVGLIAKKNGMDVGVAIHLSSFAKHKKIIIIENKVKQAY